MVHVYSVEKNESVFLSTILTGSAKVTSTGTFGIGSTNESVTTYKYSKDNIYGTWDIRASVVVEGASGFLRYVICYILFTLLICLFLFTHVDM